MANNTLKYLIELGLNDKATAAARRFDQQLLVVESHARQVNESLRDSTNGMESKFNMLGNSINQITRELPAFSVSANTGFLAISNNLPILADAIASGSTMVRIGTAIFGARNYVKDDTRESSK